MTTPIRILFVDTETNGLPKNSYAPPAEHKAWPAILQISWIICSLTEEGEFELVDTKNYQVTLPPEIAWDAGAASIHRMTEVNARSGGQDAGDVLTRFAHALATCQAVVAHNLHFDKSVIRAAGHRVSEKRGHLAPLRFMWPAGIQEFCTMVSTRDVVGIPSRHPEARHPFKVPRLSELFTFLYGKSYDVSGAEFHNAACDVDCLVQCFWGLVERGWMIVRAGRLQWTPPGTLTLDA
jgi:DNA polymerase-3 subunit epsilon